MKSGSQKLAPEYRPLSYPEARAYIRTIVREDGALSMTAELHYASGGKHDWDIRCSRSARSLEEKDIVAAQLAAELTRKYEKKLRENIAAAHIDKPYTSALDALDDEQQKSLVPVTRRSPKYIQQSISELRIFLGILDTYGQDVREGDLNAVVEERRRLASENKNAIKDPETTATTVNNSVKAFNSLYPALRAAQPDYHLPELHLPLLLMGRGAKREQVKVLPDDMLVMFGALLWRLLDHGLMLGAALMLKGMARTAEACAPKFKHFLIYDNYAVFGILYQSNGKIVPVDVLKSYAAYRLVVLPKFARDLIVARMDHLESQGFTKDEILELPAVSTPGDPKSMAAPSELSAFVRDLLTLVGCDNGFWNSVAQLISSEPDLDGFGHINLDPSAYILRRNGCSQLVNRCGMHPDLVDVLMGHELKNSSNHWKKWVRLPTSWQEIAEAEERWILDPEHSAHPGIQAVELESAADLQLLMFTDAAFRAVEDGCYTFAFEAAENNDAVSITTPRPNAEIHLPMVNIIPADPSPIIGSIPSNEFFQKYKRKASKLDLSNITKPGGGGDET